ncbi:uncharacterized protein TRAVEDRAFT_64172 [Trametes versicolor FP-101664 SS1]|uniref:uncharacterized protein n=1 Tax=Trametes versicolor (strain FP-101664) TaxID=717944 RepID=UPI000462124B|nr:uncharacterized protein TRAVEDRAFT_64172 [Trametes versicolor FP-101664 SS1]EIW60819.1 hypothetical protein TRAVEDRAFT_64172 [Trametes versicolor FP-101664 SS1]
MEISDPTTLQGIAFHPAPACGYCWKYESDLPANTKLKRCVGCSVALYCSRDCQKAAWATHKRLCRPSDSESAPNSLPNQLAGHSTPLELFTNLNEWVSNTHDYAFRTLMRAAVLLNGGGLAANFAEPCIVVFKLTRVAEPKTPAHAFQLKVQVPQTLKGEGLRATVKEGQAAVHAACQLQFEAIRRANAAIPEYAGALLAMVWVEGTEIVAYHPYPIYGLRSGDTGPLSERMSPVFEGVVAMCVGTMNAGLVLHPPRGNGPPEPDVGVLLKRKKKWDWKRRERWAWKRDVSLPSRMDPDLVWAAYHIL